MATTSAEPQPSGPATAFPPLSLTPTSFPMVWDEILLHADESTFPSLRATSKDLHKRISKTLYKHVSVHLTKSGDRLHIDLRAPYTGQRVPGLDWDGARALCLERLEAHCMTIDEVVGTPETTLDGVCDVDVKAFRSLELALAYVLTHRCARNTYRSMFALPRLLMVVGFLGREPPTTVPGDGQNPTSHVFRDFRAASVSIVVLNIRLSESAFLLQDLVHLPKLSRLIVILPKDDVGLRTPSGVWNALGNIFLGISILLPRVRLHIAGLESFPDIDEQGDAGPTTPWEERVYNLSVRVALHVGAFKSTVAGNEAKAWLTAVTEGRQREGAELQDIHDVITIQQLERLRLYIGDDLYVPFTLLPAVSLEASPSGNSGGG